jgi:uncharacterized membrane protein YeaQ/YmgE (transglycosylase-associated protein family)
MGTNSQQGIILDILVGVIGAFVAGWFLSPIFGVGTINDAVTLPTMLVTLVGAVLLLFVVKLFRKVEGFYPLKISIFIIATIRTQAAALLLKRSWYRSSEAV